MKTQTKIRKEGFIDIIGMLFFLALKLCLLPFLIVIYLIVKVLSYGAFKGLFAALLSYNNKEKKKGEK